MGDDINRFFPYTRWRPGQRALAEKVYDAITSNKILLVGYPIGHGKTAATLSAALASNAKKILYLARSKLQFQAPIREIFLLKKRGIYVDTTVLSSKQEYCPLSFAKKFEYKEFLILCSRLRKNGKCPYTTTINKYLENIIESQPLININIARRLARESRVCPYEIALSSLKKSRVIILSYTYLFSPLLRKVALEQHGINLEESVIIVDEAHNLPGNITESLSVKISQLTLSKARQEILNIKSAESASIARRLSYFKTLMKDEPGEISSQVILSLLPSSEKLYKLSSFIERDLLYVSAVRRIADLVYLLENYGEKVITTINIRGELIATLYDASRIAKHVFSKVKSAILLSATMPPREYMVRMLGIPSYRHVEEVVYPYTWGSNAKVYLVTGLSSRFAERNEKTYRRYAAIIDLFHSDSGVTLVIAPSYNFAQKLYSLVKSRPLFIEKRSSSLDSIKSALISSISEEGKAIFIAVAWGKVVEGVEFTVDNKSIISRIIITGLPIPEPSPKNRRIYATLVQQLGNTNAAWKIVYIYPALYKIIQSIGRGIRSRKDRVEALIIDDRAALYAVDYLEKYGLHPRIISIHDLVGLYLKNKSI